jgi:hypothetical protein
VKSNLALNLVYQYVTYSENDELKGKYRVLYFFSEVGKVQEKILNNKYADLQADLGADPSVKMNQFEFNNLEELGVFALNICIEVRSPEVFILSVQDYNNGIETISEVRGFKDLFRRYGNCITNPELPIEKNNLFSRLFSKK